ncbi:MAG: methionyl-tRNA formyltransferase [Eudoraea sp.]|nr:methionyl-tRNA formyltransferase [Eudoraea sp.]
MKLNIILSEKSIHETLYKNLAQNKPNCKWLLINKKSEFRYDNLKALNPDYIFIPHWSYIIPEKIYLNFKCVIFHMTDLPFGRGGSPLQNLIIRGYKKTKISALLAGKEVDAGPIFLKKDLSLKGTAEEIFIRAIRVVEEMILDIIKDNPEPISQVGKVTFFKRRTPEMSSIKEINSIEKLYDFIRMLDAEGYPQAFLDTDTFRIEFKKASLSEDETINANVRIFKK